MGRIWHWLRFTSYIFNKLHWVNFIEYERTGNKKLHLRGVFCCLEITFQAAGCLRPNHDCHSFFSHTTRTEEAMKIEE